MHTYIHINLSLPLPMPSVYPRSALACRGPDPVACEGRPLGSQLRRCGVALGVSAVLHVSPRREGTAAAHFAVHRNVARDRDGNGWIGWIGAWKVDGKKYNMVNGWGGWVWWNKYRKLIGNQSKSVGQIFGSFDSEDGIGIGAGKVWKIPSGMEWNQLAGDMIWIGTGEVIWYSKSATVTLPKFEVYDIGYTGIPYTFIRDDLSWPSHG